MDITPLCGWINNPKEVEKFLATLPQPEFKIAGANLKDSGVGKDIFLWDFEQKILGKILGAHKQEIGDCFPAGSKVVMADGSEKNIEDIVVGEKVISGQNNIRTVTNTIKKKYTGKLCTMQLKGYSIPVTATPDHKFVKYIDKDKWQWEPIVNLNSGDLVSINSCNIEKNDYIVIDLTEILNVNVVDNIFVKSNSSKLVNRFIKLDERLGWLIGLFLAEGSNSKNNKNTFNTINIWLNSKETVLAEQVVTLFKDIFGIDCTNKVLNRNPVTVREVYCNSTIIANFFKKLISGNVYSKKVPKEIFNSPKSVRLACLRGWIEGSRGINASQDLLRGMFRLALSCDLQPKLNMRKKAAHQRVAAGQICLYSENSVAVYPEYKTEVETKISFASKKDKYKTKLGTALPVESVKFEDVKDVEVYCLEVEEDHSFTVFGYTCSNCVSHGWSRGAQDVVLAQIAMGAPEQWAGEVASEPIYGGSRVQIGGQRGSYEDGSVGAWAADWMKRYGMILRKVYGSIDLTTYNPRLAKEYGARGCPQELESEAKAHGFKTVSLVKTYEEARDAITNFYPVPVCSNQGFTMERDSNGFCRPQGSWFHCMLFRGSGIAKGNKPFLALQQSWGESPTGNNRLVLESGLEIILPQGVFAVDADVCNRMLRQEDSYAASGANGYPAQKVSWYI